MHQRRGVQAEAGAEGQARQRGAAEPRGGRKGAGERSMAERRERGGRAAHTQHRRWDCGNCIVGEEVAATLRAPGICLGLFFYVGYTTHLSSYAAALFVRLVVPARRPPECSPIELGETASA